MSSRRSVGPRAVTETQATQPTDMSEEDRSKEEFFVKLADISESMIAAHGKEFAMGVLIIAARFIAEGKPLKSDAVGQGIAEATQPPQ